MEAFPTYLRIMEQSRNFLPAEDNSYLDDMAPNMNYPMSTYGTADGGVSNFRLPPFSMFQSAAAGSLPSLVNVNPVSTPRVVPSFVDVDSLMRLRQLTNSVCLVGGLNLPVRTQGSDEFVQVGVAVNDPSAVPQVNPAEPRPRARDDQLPHSTQRLVHSLRKQVRELQRQMADVESEFQIRYHREQAMNTTLRRLVDQYQAAAKFKCDQATQVDYLFVATKRDQAVQTSDFPYDSRPSCSRQTLNHTERNEMESSIIEPRNSTAKTKTSAQLSVDSVETEGPPPVAVTERDTRRPSGSSDSSSNDSEDLGVRNAQSGGRGELSGKRERSPTTRGVHGITSVGSEGYSDFPASHPFRRSRHIVLPPLVPEDYCNACYEKMPWRTPSKFCSACNTLMGRFSDAYRANRNIQLPDCTHPMGDPKRHCKGCAFKVYTFRHNLRYPTSPLPFPVFY